MIPRSAICAFVMLTLCGFVLACSGSGTFATEAPPRLRTGKFVISAADRAWWAFQPVLPRATSVTHSEASRSRIDELLGSALAQRGLTMNAPATPRELVRRATFDLLGLPPTMEEVASFEAEPTDKAWAALVDRLLASPQYGERWARHWLDLVRYAESNGYERDGPKPNAWRFRDYVIRSFNEDKPYDRFVREQLAGDELQQDPSAAFQPIIATGFYRLHVWDDEPDSTIAAEYDDLDDVLVTTSTAFLGVTLGCARCHDHKFDPFSQADYYSMLSFFRGIDPYGLHKTGGGGRGTGKIERALATPDELRKWENDKAQRLQKLDAELRAIAASTNSDPKKRLEEDLARTRADRGPFGYALAVNENGPTPKPTYILARGDPASPRDEVRPAFPAIFEAPFPELPELATFDPSAATSGRRRVLADWVASGTNPLTARVMVNRLWQHHFGVGLVATPDDFGRTGTPPSNPALLDYLAGEFIAQEWSIKRIHKLIMTSRAYRMSSRSDNPRALQVDEANVLLWRQNIQRLEAEAIRDTMLSVSGALNLKGGGPSVYPQLAPEVHGTQDSAGKGWADSPLAEQNRRSVYLVVKRALKIPLLECFDFANSTSPAGTRSVTTTAPQALMLLNDSFVHAQAENLYERLRREVGDTPDALVTRAFQIALQRLPRPAEREACTQMIQEAKVEARATANAERTAMVSFCRALLNLNEVIYVD